MVRITGTTHNNDDDEEILNYGDGISHQTPAEGYNLNPSNCDHLEIVTQMDLEDLECLLNLGSDIPMACLDEECGWKGYLDDKLYNSWKPITVQHDSVDGGPTRIYRGQLYLKKGWGVSL